MKVDWLYCPVCGNKKPSELTESGYRLYDEIEMALLSIRSSNIAFTMGATGSLLERADNYEGELKIY